MASLLSISRAVDVTGACSRNPLPRQPPPLPTRLFAGGAPLGFLPTSPVSLAASRRRGMATSGLRPRSGLSEEASLYSDLETRLNADTNYSETRLNADKNLLKLQTIQGLKERVNEAITNVTLSASPFDIAWVAMVPSPDSPITPSFPKCLEWILQNQRPNGSWTPSGYANYHIKDSLSSTLACTMALQKWSVGYEHIRRGIEFIKHNSASSIDENQLSPIGFNIIFTRMIQYGKALGLVIPIDEAISTTLFSMHDKELERYTKSNKWGAYLACVAEAIYPTQDYDQLKKYQRKNGSLFNSPSTTAAMLTKVEDLKAMNYLRFVVHKFGGAVPIVHPSDIYARINIVDSLERLGIAHHCSHYIESVLDETYRWLQDEEVHTEVPVCALAFRILSMHGYHVPSGLFAAMDEDEILSYISNIYPENISTMLELYQASQVQISKNEISMRKLHCQSRDFLEKSLSNVVIHNDLEKFLFQEVDYNLNFAFFEKLDLFENKRNIENYNANNVHYLKASFMFQNIDESDFLKLAVDDFNFRQSLYREEFQLFQRWAQEKKLSHLFGIDYNRILYIYFAAATSITSPELSDARLSWAKNSLLVVLIDDIFDGFGTSKEQDNMVELCRRWHPDYKKHCCSTEIYILFDALYSTITELGRKASSIHGYNVTTHLIELWIDVINSMKVEAEWQSKGTIPTMEQYMSNGIVSTGLGPIVLPSMYFIGPRLSLEMVKSKEYQDLVKSACICGRLSNDIQGFEREAYQENKLNSVSIKKHYGSEMVSDEDAKRDLWKSCDASRDELLELVLRRDRSVVPRACKELLWNMCKIYYAFYKKNDAFKNGGEDWLAVVKAVIHEPICVSNLSSTDEIVK